VYLEAIFLSHNFLPIFLFDMLLAIGRGGGFGNLMFDLWLTGLGSSFVFFGNVGPSILFLVFPFFGCFGYFMVDKVP